MLLLFLACTPLADPPGEESAAEDSTTPDDSGGAALPAPSHGPYVTGATADGGTIWARWPHAAGARAFLSPTPDFAAPIVTEPLVADAAHDHTLHWNVSGLGAAARWYYTVGSGELPDAAAVARARSFQTFPAASSGDPVTVVFLADSKSWFPGTATAAAAAEAPSLVVQLGDFDHRNPGDMGTGRPAWWEMHRDNLFDDRAGLDLDQNLLRTTPFAHIWDDHDYGANNAARDAPWREDALAAFLDYFPLDARPDPELGLWHGARLGPVELFVLDLRSQRDPYDAGDEATRSILGCRDGACAQLEWLRAGLHSSDAPWKVVVTSSLWNPAGKTQDTWAAYPADRARVLEAVEGVGGVVLVSADIHSGGAIDDGAHSVLPELSVPTMNMHGPCTGQDAGCGQWSVGLYDENDVEHFAGYALVRADAATLTLETHGADGTLRLRYRLPAR